MSTLSEFSAQSGKGELVARFVTTPDEHRLHFSSIGKVLMRSEYSLSAAIKKLAIAVVVVLGIYAYLRYAVIWLKLGGYEFSGHFAILLVSGLPILGVTLLIQRMLTKQFAICIDRCIAASNHGPVELYAHTDGLFLGSDDSALFLSFGSLHSTYAIGDGIVLGSGPFSFFVPNRGFVKDFSKERFTNLIREKSGEKALSFEVPSR